MQPYPFLGDGEVRDKKTGGVKVSRSIRFKRRGGTEPAAHSFFTDPT